MIVSGAGFRGEGGIGDSIGYEAPVHNDRTAYGTPTALIKDTRGDEQQTEGYGKRRLLAVK